MDAETFRETVLESVRGERKWVFGTGSDGFPTAHAVLPVWTFVRCTDTGWTVSIGNKLSCMGLGDTLDEVLEKMRPLADLMGVEL